MDLKYGKEVESYACRRMDLTMQLRACFGRGEASRDNRVWWDGAVCNIGGFEGTALVEGPAAVEPAV